jgi:hypothetical protein
MKKARMRVVASALLVLMAVIALSGWTWYETRAHAEAVVADPVVQIAPYKILPDGALVFEANYKRISEVTDQEIAVFLAPPPPVDCGSSGVNGSCCSTSLNGVTVQAQN